MDDPTDTLRARVEQAQALAAAPDFVALVTDLWAAYATRAQDASVAVARACLERDEARKERDAALAEVARLRAAADAVPVSAGGRVLVWFGNNDFVGWHLGPSGTCDAFKAPYSAWLSGAAGAYPSCGASHDTIVPCGNLRAACRQIAEWAREDDHIIPPHPLGWDVGVSDG